MTDDPITFADVEAAKERIDDRSVVKRTPVERSTSLEETTGAERVFLKMEHLQWTGSFKTRGAYNAIKQLVATGDVDHVVAASAGNHAQGVALAATTLGVDSTIVMPKAAPQAKVDATKGYGASVELVGRNFGEAMAHAKELVQGDGTAFIHAFDDPAIVAGQGTLGIEMYEQRADVDTVVVPIGGGGLIGGISTALDSLSPSTRIVGVQATGSATVPDSLEKGSPQTVEPGRTIADGIATGSLSELTFSLIEAHVDEVVTVTDDAIARAILYLTERAKQVVEGGGAAPVAALMDGAVDVSDETVMVLLSGGNLDMTMLQMVLVHALDARKQLIRAKVKIDDQPGKMADISGIIADHDANIRTVRHERATGELEVGEAYLDFTIETSGIEHARAIVEAIAANGYELETAGSLEPDGA